jgi:hypothetical protein
VILGEHTSGGESDNDNAVSVVMKWVKSGEPSRNEDGAEALVGQPAGPVDHGGHGDEGLLVLRHQRGARTWASATTSWIRRIVRVLTSSVR